MRRKRRNRGLWMPNLGFRVQDDANQAYGYADRLIPAQQIIATNALGPSFILAATPLIPDFTQEQFQSDAVPATSVTANLHDIASGSAWSLHRIVGKIHLCSYAGAAPAAADVIWPAVYVTFGLFVARSADDLQGVADLTLQEQDPQDVDNVMNPWIFRRSWILGNPAAPTDQPKWPTCNAQYGSMADGPHIDSRVKRFIPREHRLFMVCTARGFHANLPIRVTGPDGDQPFIGGTFDYRIHGSLRRSKNSSSF